MRENTHLEMNRRAYISASLRFLASTIISCNSTDTSSETSREREGGKGGLQGEKRKLKGKKARTAGNIDCTVSRCGFSAQADKSFSNQQFGTARGQFALPVDQFFAPSITVNHRWLNLQFGACCWIRI